MEKLFLHSTTGAKLNLYQNIPLRDPKALIHITHGLTEHTLRYKWFSERLSQENFAVFAHDLRGHGFTSSEDSDLGIFSNQNGFDKLIWDHGFVINHICNKFPNTPIFCFGHSFGSILNLNYAIRFPTKLNGLACWNSVLETGLLAYLGKTIFELEVAFRNTRKPSLLAKHLTFDAWNKKFKPNRTDFDWLSRDQKQVDDYIADPLCGFSVSLSCWRDIMKSVFFGSKNLNRIPLHLPIFILGGAEDACTNIGRDMTDLLDRLVALGHTKVTCKILDGTRHESLNELKREEAFKLYLNWVNQALD
ncbi:MAG: lysophospholipase [Rhodobacteraceae bacterium]|nr:lysophospholipase [Paracoccaceae bacterium]